MIVSALLIAGLASAAPAPVGNTFVNGRVSRGLSGVIEIYEPWLQVNQWVNPWSGGANVSGTPLNLNVSRSLNSLYFFGGSIDGNASEFGGNWRVNATVRRPGQSPIGLNFTMQIIGRVDDPNNPPSFNVWDAGASLHLEPSGGGRDYALSGWVDSSRFGAEGVALVGVIAGLSLDHRAPAPESAPRGAPDRVFRVLPFPALPIRP